MREEFEGFWEARDDAKPCPFCGSDKLRFREESDPDGEFCGYFIECIFCGAASGKGVDKGDAYLLWQAWCNRAEQSWQPGD
jgi:hypothetical protein